MVAVGAAWPLLIALTPAGSRPWVSGTSDNSILSLILGYNGVGRLSGQAGGPGGGRAAVVAAAASSAARPACSACSTPRSGAQAGWLLGFALVGGIAILVGSRLRRADARTGWLIATGGAFLACAVAFSAAQGIFHPYYVSLLAPFTAALVGGGVGQFLRGERSSLWLAPVAVVIGGVVELVVLNNTAGSPGWARTLIIVTGIVAVAAMVGGVLEARAHDRARHRARGPARRPGDLVGPDARPRHQRHVPRRRPGDDRRVRRAGWSRAAAAARPGLHRRAARRDAPTATPAGNARRRHVRRQLGRPDLRARLRQGPRRRHDRGVEPDGARRPRSSTRAPTSPASAASPAASRRSAWPG